MTDTLKNVDERIHHLGNPPIVEAVIHWQARAQQPFDLQRWKTELAELLPGYGNPEPIQRFETLMMLQSEGGAAPTVSTQQELDGLRLTSDDKVHIVQVKRDGVVFSRLKPYRDWEQFTNAALPSWNAFLKLASPVEIERLGVRFINHIPNAKADVLGATLREPPTCPANLPLNEFVYQSTFLVPDQPFAIRVIKMMQPAPNAPEASGLFLDCDVFTTKPLSCDSSEVIDALANMRKLKNRIFFSLLTDETIQSFE